MQSVIYSSEQHKQTIEIFTDMCKQFVEEVTTKTKYQNYIEVLRTINEYSNGYGQGVKENNFYDWLMIIPINTSVATNGFFAGIETKSNAAVVRAYKVVLDQMLQETVGRIDLLETTND